jgi:hypothetical protein
MGLVSSCRWGVVILWMCEQEHELVNRSKKKYSKYIHFMSNGIFRDKFNDMSKYTSTKKFPRVSIN